MNFKFDPQTLKETLPIMRKGMIGIFTVTLVIICTIWLLNKFVSKAD